MGKVVTILSKKEDTNMLAVERVKNEPVFVSEMQSNLLQLAKLILFFCNNSSIKLYKTKIHKLLFYTQFLYYKTYHMRLLNDEFVCDYYGPIIPELDYYLRLLESVSVIRLTNTGYGTVISARMKLNEREYAQEELLILKKVHNKFDKFSASEISDYSHKETLWSNTMLKQVIDIDRAFELRDLQ